MRIEDISPDEVGEPRIRVSLVDPSAPRIAHSPISIAISYAACEPAGVVLPIIVTVSRAASQASYRRTVFRLVRPNSYLFVPLEGGRHVVLVSEAFHNRWRGSLAFDVIGENLQEVV